MPVKEFDGRTYTVDDELFYKLEAITEPAEVADKDDRVAAMIGSMINECETQSQYVDLYTYLILWRELHPAQLSRISRVADMSLCRKVAFAAKKLRRNKEVGIYPPTVRVSSLTGS
ncbi:MAG TPA: hypothetical protein PK543_00070 [Candidatus Saccharibacteria bacterium]|nr:hypothetical protein [Candidatus Saccharibacteria bacterium]